MNLTGAFHKRRMGDDTGSAQWPGESSSNCMCNFCVVIFHTYNIAVTADCEVLLISMIEKNPKANSLPCFADGNPVAQ